MLKPSAAPPSNHETIVSAAWSGVPMNVKCPRPPPSRESDLPNRQVLANRELDDEVRSTLRTFEFRPGQDEVG